jgi:hypothetical protein
MIMLNALCASPDAVMAMLYWLRAELLRVDPELARLSAGVPDPGLRARIKRDVLIETNLEVMARIKARKQARLPKVVRRRLRA